MENARPDQRIHFEFWLEDRSSIDEEVEVEVFADCKQIVFNVFKFLVSAKHIDCVHLARYVAVECGNDFVSKLLRELVLFEVFETLTNEPDVHVGY